MKNEINYKEQYLNIQILLNQSKEEIKRENENIMKLKSENTKYYNDIKNYKEVILKLNDEIKSLKETIKNKDKYYNEKVLVTSLLQDVKFNWSRK
ncbi:hypothetical protein HBE96_03270 [Clostridium sp. P21]|uniref:Uncharacterized protein n=1 Tax=Clostridium muellerianum TaxID=2716538 RepID=A0A7Y0HM21_9CLOT|nr:hypothetical protein [Clostridium muellerianum]NMM61725.1 hypothetical protein [Clostridium muellerianum]